MAKCRASLYEPFKHWGEKGRIMVISDPHIGDEDMNWRVKNATTESLEGIITIRILSNLNKFDTLIVLGDIGCKWKKIVPELDRLKIYTVLIKGNHDRTFLDSLYCFDEIYEGGLQIGPKLYLSHEPQYALGCLNLHGHDHGNAGLILGHRPRRTDNYSYVQANLCCEGYQFEPVNLDDVVKSGILKQIDDIHRQTVLKAESSDYFPLSKGIDEIFSFKTVPRIK